MFVSPWIFGFIVFTPGPLLFSLYAAFTNYDITSRMDFVGAANFRRLFTLDPLFATSVYNTLYYVVFSVPLRTACGVLLAVMLNQGVMFRRVLRTVYYMPSVLSGVAVYLLWCSSSAHHLVSSICCWRWLAFRAQPGCLIRGGQSQP